MSHKRARTKTRVRAIDQTWDVWSDDEEEWVDVHHGGTAESARPPRSSYYDTARRVPTTVFPDSAELVSNWRGAIKCRHERARPGNCLIS